MARMKVQVVPYRARWATAFADESASLRSALGELVIQLHHIGSTAVPGLAAKPVIDMILEVNALEILDSRTSLLEELGYEAMGEFGIAGRRYFRKGGDQRTHQIHAFQTGDANILRHLAFRDYLRAHPSVRNDYAGLKIKVASECEGSLEKYCDGKDSFIQVQERKALEWSLTINAYEVPTGPG